MYKCILPVITQILLATGVLAWCDDGKHVCDACVVYNPGAMVKSDFCSKISSETDTSHRMATAIPIRKRDYCTAFRRSLMVPTRRRMVAQTYSPAVIRVEHSTKWYGEGDEDGDFDWGLKKEAGSAGIL